MRGQQVTIPLLGMNNQLLNDQSVDGLCDSIINLKPKGTLESPYWAPFEKINPLKNSALTDFSYEFGISSITDAFWQVRNDIGEYSINPNGSLKRLMVLCQNSSRKCIDIIEPTTWKVVKTQALPATGTYSWSCTRLDEVTIITINRDKKPYLLYYVIDDAFIPAGWPEMPKITFSTAVETLTQAQVDAGNTKGVMREATDQWFMATWVFRLFDGSYIKHQAPILTLVEAGSTFQAVKPVFTLNGYSAVENLLIEQPFWKGLIAGIGVCCTIPRNEKQTVLDDGAFFQVGYWPYIDRLPEAQWPTAADPNIITVETKSDSWPTLRKLSIDNFTHHRYSSRVLDTYNKRVLLGGSAVDFIKPKIATNATQNTVDGGVYSDYIDFKSGLGTFNYEYYLNDGSTATADTFDYEIEQQDHEANFTPKSGREFKAVTILESNVGAENVLPPSGGALPKTTYAASIVAGELVFDVMSRQSAYSDGVNTGLLPSPGAYMKLKVGIGPAGGTTTDEEIIFTTYPSGTNQPYFTFSNVELVADNVTVAAKIFHRITIKTDSGTYYRIKIGDIASGQTTVTVPELIWYPDRRAIKYELIVENAGVYEVALDKQLTQHPESNYSYVYLTTAEQTYTIGASAVTTTQPDIKVNDVLQYVPNRIQPSLSGNPFLFDAVSYRVGNRENDTILGFGINLNPTSEGQAGQFPVYAFSDKGVWALEQTADPTIAFGKISPVSNFNGINNPYAITNANNLIIACDNKYIYALAGLTSERIDEEIANDPDYKDYLKQIRIGYHRASDYEELIFSNPFYDYSLCYNLKYKVWYKATERFKFFFYDYPELMGMTVDHVIKDFSSKDEESPVAWEMITRVIQYKEPYVYKRFFPSFVRMELKQPLKQTEAEYLPVRIRLKGYRDDKAITYNLYDKSIKTDFLYDPRIYNQYGSMYAYRIYLNGTNYHKGGRILWIDSDMEYRYQVTKRRNNCSAQYLYTMENSAISICNCSEGGGGTDAYFSYTGTAEESRVITHNLGKIPSVFVTDENGFLIEVGVQLIITDGQPDQPDLNRVRLTFEDPVNYKAYLN